MLKAFEILCPLPNLLFKLNGLGFLTFSELTVTPLLKFAHRSNFDGTVDSICYRCIATVATVYAEHELLKFEREHVCDPVQVERFHGKKPPSSESTALFNTFVGNE
jgi:hypothetical protein